MVLKLDTNKENYEGMVGRKANYVLLLLKNLSKISLDLLEANGLLLPANFLIC